MEAIRYEASVDVSLRHYKGSSDPFDLSFLTRPPPQTPRDARPGPPEGAINEYFGRDDRGVVPRAHHHVVMNGHHPPGP
jgi:hypothetical protein